MGNRKRKKEDGVASMGQTDAKKCRGGLGFKDLRLFNQALLARQAWRLIEYPESLCARMLKAKYYPRGHLLDTAFASNPSQTWQAILHGLELLKKGVIWRIGDGRQIRIWRDPWIPRGFSHRVTTLRGRNRFHWVADLMNSDGSNWDYNRIASIFNAADREAISKIRLGQRRTEDFIAWQPDKTG